MQNLIRKKQFFTKVSVQLLALILVLRTRIWENRANIPVIHTCLTHKVIRDTALMGTVLPAGLVFLLDPVFHRITQHIATCIQVLLGIRVLRGLIPVSIPVSLDRVKTIRLARFKVRITLTIVIEIKTIIKLPL